MYTVLQQKGIVVFLTFELSPERLLVAKVNSSVLLSCHCFLLHQLHYIMLHVHMYVHERAKFRNVANNGS